MKLSQWSFKALPSLTGPISGDEEDAMDNLSASSVLDVLSSSDEAT